MGGESSKLVVATANRLRLVQTDLADEQPDVRQQYLADEVERALAQVVPAERPAFLEALQEWFPTWERVDVGPNAENSMSQSTSDQRDLQDASFLVERLIDLAPSMSEQERQAVASRMRDAGLSSEGRQIWPQQSADKLRTHLKLPETEDIDPLRSLELLQMQVDFFLSLDQLVWSTWKAVSPRSDIKGSGELKKCLGPFLQGNQDVPRGEVMMHLEKLRQLTAALISAISQSGRQFAHSHYGRFNPEVIEEAAKREKKAMESVSSAAWRKYREILGTSDQATIEREIMQLIAEYAEKLMKGLSR
jgi:hypothetical protein